MNRNSAFAVGNLNPVRTNRSGPSLLLESLSCQKPILSILKPWLEKDNPWGAEHAYHAETHTTKKTEARVSEYDGHGFQLKPRMVKKASSQLKNSNL
jgi:hypothetical protein